MPTLVLSSHFTTDSQILRETARNLGWDTLRLEGDRVPDWFEPPDEQIAIFATAPQAFDIASQFGRCLAGCPSDWTVSLPHRFLSRKIRQTNLADALSSKAPQFVKHGLRKAFPAAVYNPESLAETTKNMRASAVVHVSEPVEFEVEYRCFVSDHKIAAMSPYLRFGNFIENHRDNLNCTPDETNAATEFANAVLNCDEIRCPPAFVLDVGLIADRGWAVVEFNQCWASGIYACDPEKVLQTLLRGCGPSALFDDEWDFRKHYYSN